MKRWIKRNGKGEEGESPKVDAFLADILKVCEQHGMSIAHEDGHGAFIIEPPSEHNKKWLLDATDETEA